MSNYVKLNFLSDDIAFLYVNCIFVIGSEHPKLSFFSHVQLRNTNCNGIVLLIRFSLVRVDSAKFLGIIIDKNKSDSTR